MTKKYKMLMESESMHFSNIMLPVSANNLHSIAEYNAYQAGFTACYDEMKKDLKIISSHIMAALNYAYEDRSDRYYLIVKTTIEESLKEIGVE